MPRPKDQSQDPIYDFSHRTKNVLIPLRLGQLRGTHISNREFNVLFMMLADRFCPKDATFVGKKEPKAVASLLEKELLVEFDLLSDHNDSSVRCVQINWPKLAALLRSETKPFPDILNMSEEELAELGPEASDVNG